MQPGSGASRSRRAFLLAVLMLRLNINFAYVINSLYIQPDSNKEIMRQWIVLLGFFIIILIVISGCTSAQSGTTTGSNNQNPAQGNRNIQTTYAAKDTYPPQCWNQKSDPVRFQKFLPDVPGWTRRFGQNISNENYYLPDSGTLPSQIAETYQSTDAEVYVHLEDEGPCTTQSNGVYAFLNGGYEKELGGSGTTTKIDNFHGYPAIKLVYFIPEGYQFSHEGIYVGVNNRLRVFIHTTSYSKPYPLSEADANLEKFANAIDFNGFAASL